MREVPREYLDNYSSGLAKVSKRAQNEMRAALRQIDYSGPVDAWRDTVVGVVDAYCAGASDLAAFNSSAFYDGLRERVVGSRMGAYAQSERNQTGTDKAVRAFINKLLEDDYEGFEDLCCERLDYEVTASAGRAMAYNARHDPGAPRYARVPQGQTTCDFCVMLASRGPVYHTMESAGAFTKFHAHCDCMVLPFWNTYAIETDAGGIIRRSGTTSYEGYNPDEYFDQYVGMMLNPKFAERMARAADNAHAKNGSTYGLGRGNKWAWGIANGQGLTEFHNIHEVTSYIRDATSYEDLCERLKTISKEVEYYGLSDKQYEQLLDLCRSVRARETSK